MYVLKHGFVPLDRDDAWFDARPRVDDPLADDPRSVDDDLQALFDPVVDDGFWIPLRCAA